MIYDNSLGATFFICVIRDRQRGCSLHVNVVFVARGHWFYSNFHSLHNIKWPATSRMRFEPYTGHIKLVYTD